MEEWTRTCILCKKDLSLSKTRIMTQKGIQSCIQASIIKRDGVADILEKLNCQLIDVHASCSKSYSTSAKRFKKSEARKAKLFNYVKKCFICGENAFNDLIGEEDKSNLELQVKVNCVTTNEIQTKLIQFLENTENNKYKKVLHRLTSVGNLVTAGARYHLTCFSKLQTYIKINDFNNFQSINYKVIKHICSYIDAHRGECQFSLCDILNNYDINEWPHINVIKRELQNYFGYDVIIHKSKDQPIISFLSKRLKNMITDWWSENNKQKNQQDVHKQVLEHAAKILIEDIKGTVYKTYSFPTPDFSKNDNGINMPESLFFFLIQLIPKDKESHHNYGRLLHTICHDIMSVVTSKYDNFMHSDIWFDNLLQVSSQINPQEVAEAFEESSQMNIQESEEAPQELSQIHIHKSGEVPQELSQIHIEESGKVPQELSQIHVHESGEVPQGLSQIHIEESGEVPQELSQINIQESGDVHQELSQILIRDLFQISNLSENNICDPEEAFKTNVLLSVIGNNNIYRSENEENESHNGNDRDEQNKVNSSDCKTPCKKLKI